MRLSHEIYHIGGAFVVLAAWVEVKCRNGLAPNSIRGLRTGQMCKRVSREPGRAVAFLRQKTGWDVRFNKSPAHKSVSLLCELDGEHETGNYGRYRFPILKERKMKMKHGSRSALIVPLESRETDPWEPVSREGDASYYGIDVEKHSLHQEVRIWL